jgi:hypothetical protein
MNVVALAKIPFDSITARFAAGATPDATGFTPARGANGMNVRVRALRDAVLVATPIPFSAEPDEIGLALRKILNDLLDHHGDARGVYVFPDVAQPKADTFDGVVDELGELGSWAPVVAHDYVPKALANAPAGSFQAGVRDLMSAIPPDMMRAMEQAMASGDMSALGAMQGQLQELLAQQGDLVEKLQETLLGAMGGEGGMPDLGETLPSEEDAPELWAQARAQMEAMRAQNPELAAELEKRFGAPAPKKTPEKK